MKQIDQHNGTNGAANSGHSATSATLELSLDAALDDVLDKVEADCRAGRPVDLDALVLQYPSLAAKLRTAVPAVLAIEASSDGATLSDPPAAGVEGEVIDGERRLGDYRLIREIGRGGMGVVYEAEQVSLRRRVALKVLPFASVLDERALQRFRNEALAAASLEHPHVVSVYGTGCERGVHYLAMRYVDGMSLSGLIHAARRESGLEEAGPQVNVGPREVSSDLNVATVLQRPVSCESAASPLAETSPVAALSTAAESKGRGRHLVAAKLILQAAEAVEYAHSMGVIHRDLKPSNLLLDSKGGLWVADFGLAHLEGDASLTLTGDLMGTLRYMSPEQATGRRMLVDHRSDVYSLGLTLYELLALRPAFSQTHRTELIQAVVADEPPRPRSLVSSIPKNLETIVLKAIEKEPKRRYQSAKALAEDLRRFLADEPIIAARASLTTRSVKCFRRHRTAMIGIMTVALALSTLALTESVERAAAKHAADQAAHEDLAAALAAFDSGGFEIAIKKIAEAESRNPAAAILREAEQLKEAVVKFQNFEQYAGQALSAFDNEVWTPGVEAVSVYEVFSGAPNTDWREKLRAGPLTNRQQKEVEQTVFQILVLFANESLLWRQLFAEPSLAAVGYLEDAAKIHKPTHAIYFLRSLAYGRLDDWQAADRNRALAEATEPSTALDHFVRGRWAHAERNFEAARRHFRSALRLNPQHLPSLYFLTKATEGVPEVELLGMLGCAVSRPGHPVVQCSLAQIYHRLGFRKEADGAYRHAEATANDAINNDIIKNVRRQKSMRWWLPTSYDSRNVMLPPGNVFDPSPSWVALCGMYAAFGNERAVVDLYERLITEYPADRPLQVSAATFYLTGRFEAGPFSSELVLKPANPGRGLELANRVLNEANNPMTLDAIARLLAEVENTESGPRVAAAYERLLASRPMEPAVLASAARYYLVGPHERLRDPERAAELVREGAPLWRKRPSTLLNAAAVFAAVGRSEEFRRAAEVALEESDGSLVPGLAQAVICICTIAPGGPGDTTALAAIADSAAAKEPSPSHWHAAGMARLRAGRPEDAAAAFSEGLEQPWDARALNLTGLALAKCALEDAEEARRRRAEARREISDNRKVYDCLVPSVLLSWCALDRELEALLAPVEARRPETDAGPQPPSEQN